MFARESETLHTTQFFRAALAKLSGSSNRPEFAGSPELIVGVISRIFGGNDLTIMTEKQS